MVGYYTGPGGGGGGGGGADSVMYILRHFQHLHMIK